MNLIGSESWTYTRDQVLCLTRTYTANGKSISATLDVAMSFIFEIPVQKFHFAVVEIVRLIERIEKIDLDGEFQDVTDETGQWIVEGLSE